MTKSRYLGKACEGLILIMPQRFSPFFISALHNDICSPVCFSDCLVSNCSKELREQLREECCIKLLAGVRTFCFNPDHLSSLKVFYLIWFNTLSRF